jgi:Transglutaminase-like superfamily
LKFGSPANLIPMNKARKFLSLSRTEQWMLARAIIELWRAWFGLRTMSFARLRSLASGLARATVAGADEPPERVAWAVAAASSFVPDGANCLIRALAAGRMLRRYGHDANLRIGVAKASPAGGLTAHAWLESGGKVVIGGFELGRYIVLDMHRKAA